jgi:hypothetical protein
MGWGMHPQALIAPQLQRWAHWSSWYRECTARRAAVLAACPRRTVLAAARDALVQDGQQAAAAT